MAKLFFALCLSLAIFSTVLGNEVAVSCRECRLQDPILDTLVRATEQVTNILFGTVAGNLRVEELRHLLGLIQNFMLTIFQALRPECRTVDEILKTLTATIVEISKQTSNAAQPIISKCKDQAVVRAVKALITGLANVPARLNNCANRGLIKALLAIALEVFGLISDLVLLVVHPSCLSQLHPLVVLVKELLVALQLLCF